MRRFPGLKWLLSMCVQLFGDKLKTFSNVFNLRVLFMHVKVDMHSKLMHVDQQTSSDLNTGPNRNKGLTSTKRTNPQH